MEIKVYEGENTGHCIRCLDCTACEAINVDHGVQPGGAPTRGAARDGSPPDAGFQVGIASVFWRSLSLKINLALVAVLVVVLGGSAVFTISAQNLQAVDNTKDQARILSRPSPTSSASTWKGAVRRM